jgi:uncharacterized membrane protein YcaP (DUF421 family)
METLVNIFGEGKDLNALQMTTRGIVIFFIALILIRISGRRSFGLHMPLDNIITIMLGAVLSRALVGASDFLAVITSCTAIVLIHRALAWLVVHKPGISKVIEGEKIILFEHGKFVKKNMNKAQVCEEDIMQGVRKSALTKDLNKIEQIFIERNGEISSIKKSSS